MRIFVAGATGVIGRQLVPLLVAAGHEVTGLTRVDERADALREAGADAVVLDIFDREALVAAVAKAEPEVVIHQVTDLATPPGQPIGEAEAVRNAHVRQVGTANLVAAAVAAGAGRIVAQSIAWLYAPGHEPHREGDQLLLPTSVTRQGVYDLERQVTADDRFAGLVLRYGRLYGEAAATATPAEPPTVSVVAAARAALLAVERGAPGIYNVVDDGGPVANDKARAELGWSPG